MNCPNCNEFDLVRMNRFGGEHIDQSKLTGHFQCPNQTTCQYTEDR